MAIEGAHKAEIIAIGNELLIGDVLDTNTNWLCRRLTIMGASVLRAVIVPDRHEDISDAVNDALRRKPDLIITSGGLGPTDDDITVSAIAEALKRPLELNEQALQMVIQRYQELHQQGYVDTTEIIPSRKKMAMLPQGAMPLFNFVGTAPGVYLKEAESLIVCLPGVPTELKGIFENSLPPYLEQVLGKGYYVERNFEVTCQDESILAPALKQVADRHPSVYLKSKAKVFGDGVKIRILLATSGNDQKKLEQILQAVVDDLTDAFETKDIILLPKEAP